MSVSDKPVLTPPVGPADHVLGGANAPLTLVEYADFECPSCEQAHAALVILREKYGSRLRSVLRHFPLREVHPHAELAAEAAEACAAQGKFWEMEALLFKNRLHLKAPALHSYAASLELDMLRYDAEMGDHIYLQRVQEHIAGGRASGVRNTPSFFLNGRPIDVSFGMERLYEALAAGAGHA